MHQTKKGNQWYFGMKAHIGVDAESGLAHTLATTPANTSDVAVAHALLHGDEEAGSDTTHLVRFYVRWSSPLKENMFGIHVLATDRISLARQRPKSTRMSVRKGFLS